MPRAPTGLMLLAAWLCCAAGTSAAGQGDAASLQVSREGAGLELLLSGPAEAFFGPGEPGTDPRLLSSGSALLQDAGSAFHLSPVAGCRIVEVLLGGRRLEAEGHAGAHRPGDRLLALRRGDRRLGGSTPSPAADAGPPGLPGDEDVIALYRYECSRPDALQQVTVLLFMGFPRLARLELRMAHDASQARTLTAASPTFVLPAPRETAR
jgi:hypothetical protein